MKQKIRLRISRSTRQNYKKVVKDVVIIIMLVSFQAMIVVGFLLNIGWIFNIVLIALFIVFLRGSIITIKGIFSSLRVEELIYFDNSLWISGKILLDRASIDKIVRYSRGLYVLKMKQGEDVYFFASVRYELKKSARDWPNFFSKFHLKYMGSNYIYFVVKFLAIKFKVKVVDTNNVEIPID